MSTPPVGSISSDDTLAPLSVLIVDDHSIIRRGLKDLLLQHLPIERIDEAATCHELRSYLTKQSAALVLLDLQLPDCNTLDRISEIKAQHRSTKVLVYSMGSERMYARTAIAQGACGFLSKAMDERELITAVRVVVAGGIYTSEEARPRKKDRAVDRAEPWESLFAELSDRELLVMNELLSGLSVKDISARLDLQPSTVATYKARLFDKLGVSNLLDLQRLAERAKRREKDA